MEIFYKTKKLKKILNNSKLLDNTYGTLRAQKIKTRLSDLDAVDNLKDAMDLP